MFMFLQSDDWIIMVKINVKIKVKYKKVFTKHQRQMRRLQRFHG